MERMSMVAELITKDRVLGTLAKEAVECSEENKHMAALACLFILIEQTMKFALDKTKGDFHRLTILAEDRGLISTEDSLLIHSLRQVRNKLFHETHYSWVYEKAGVAYPLSEDETKKMIFDDFSGQCFTLVLKLLRK